MIEKIEKIENDTLVLSMFNKRDSAAYSNVYSLLYKSLYYYSYSLFKDTNVDCEDIIQDVFLDIWENHQIKFNSIDKVRSFVYVAIKNRFLMWYRHQKVVDRVMAEQIKDDDYFIFQAAESEIYSIIPEAMNILPEDCAETFRLFLSGYNAKEISEKLNKPLSTIYSQRDRAVSLLRVKLSRDKFLIIMALCQNIFR